MTWRLGSSKQNACHASVRSGRVRCLLSHAEASVAGSDRATAVYRPAPFVDDAVPRYAGGMQYLRRMLKCAKTNSCSADLKCMGGIRGFIYTRAWGQRAGRAGAAGCMRSKEV